MLSTKDIRSLYSEVLMNSSLNEKKIFKIKVSRMDVLLLYHAFGHGLQLINTEAPNTIVDIAPDEMIGGVKAVVDGLFASAELKDVNDSILKLLKK